MITELFWTDGHSYAPGHEPSVLDWIRYFINENTELLIAIGSGFVSFYITLFCLRRIVAVIRRTLRDPYAEEEAAQEALRKLAEAEAQREPRVRRRVAPGAVQSEGYADGEGRDGMEAASAGGYPGHYAGDQAHDAEGYGGDRYGSERYGADQYATERFGATGHAAASHGTAARGSAAPAFAAESRHSPRPGSFFAHRGERAAR
jgi:hypothetical protein